MVKLLKRGDVKIQQGASQSPCSQFGSVSVVVLFVVPFVLGERLLRYLATQGHMKWIWSGKGKNSLNERKLKNIFT